jgi:hypothetical protein
VVGFDESSGLFLRPTPVIDCRKRHETGEDHSTPFPMQVSGRLPLPNMMGKVAAKVMCDVMPQPITDDAVS